MIIKMPVRKLKQVNDQLWDVYSADNYEVAHDLSEPQADLITNAINSECEHALAERDERDERDEVPGFIKDLRADGWDFNVDNVTLWKHSDGTTKFVHLTETEASELNRYVATILNSSRSSSGC
jgi:hypothetical protein